MIAFYDRRVDSAVVSSRHFDRWWKDARRSEPELLTMTAEALGRASDNDADQYPTTWAQADMVFPVTYRFDPGAADDGVTVHVPLAVLGRLTTDGFDWQVPGFRADLVAALMQTLPKDIRRQLIPAAETTAAAYRLLEVADEPLAVALARAVETAVPSVRVPPRAFDATSGARPPANHVRRSRRDRRCGRHRQGPQRRQAAVAGDASRGCCPGDTGRRASRHHHVGRRRSAAARRHRARRPHGARISGAARRRRQRLAACLHHRPNCRSG